MSHEQTRIGGNFLWEEEGEWWYQQWVGDGLLDHLQTYWSCCTSSFFLSDAFSRWLLYGLQGAMRSRKVLL